MKRLFYPPPIRELFLVLSLLLVGNQLVFAEGSRDFRDYEGFRLFYLISPAADGSVTNEQQLKVYGAAGEFINVGSSHVGIQGGFILVYRPDGTLHSTFNGADGTAIINDDVEEFDGPSGGGTINGDGYVPGVIQVQEGEAGVWTVVLDYPPENYTSANFDNLMNGDPWTRAIDQPATGRVALAWDVTISQGGAGNTGGTLVEGRVYSNEYISIVSQNGNATSPTFFILTRSGFSYQIDFMQADPWGFPLFSNSRGIVRGDQTATNQSFDRSDYIRTADIASFEEDLLYLYHPQAEDTGLISNNKIFFNPPDSNMPNVAVVTDIVNGFNTHVTWLFTEVADQNIGENPFGFTGNVPADGVCSPNLTMQEGEGGNFVYDSQVGGIGQLLLDLDNNGSFNDPIDRIIESEAVLGQGNNIFWDGRDGLGNIIPANPNFQFNFDLSVRGGEIHVLMDDVENNLGGVAFTRLNGVNSPSNIFFYDHSQIPLLEVSGGGTPGNALPTSELFTYGNALGDNQLLDFYSFVDANNFGSGAIAIAVETDCSAAAVALIDTDGDGIDDEDDLDDDNDGISDIVEGSGDTDGDGVPDALDLDSDNDGIFDVIEAGHGQVDANGDGIIDGAVADFGANGLFNAVASSADDINAVINYTPADTDGDGVANWLDLDSDNDGILDVRENQNLDQDNDGIIGTGNPIVNASGIATASENGSGITINPNVVNTDGTDGGDYIDLDSDGDGLLDAAEAGRIDGDGDGILGTGTPTVNVSGIPSATDINGNIFTATSNVPDSNNDGIADFQEVLVAPPPPPPPPAPIMDNDGDGIADEDDLDDDNDGISDLVEGSGDTDGDGVPDFLDLDSDNDGIFDVIEAGHGQVDANNDGIIDGTDFGANGLHNPLASSANDLNAVINYTPADTDGDGVPNWRDLDSDNDGIFDVRENQNLDQDNDGIIGLGNPIVNASGIATASSNGSGLTINPNVVNTDGTGGGDYIDLDSDGDTLLDAAEAGRIDGDGDGILGTGTPTVDVNGVPSETNVNGTFTATSNPPDSNNNGIADFQEVFVNPPVVDPPVVDPPVVDPPPGFVCDETTTPVLSSVTGGAGAYCVGGAAPLSVSGTINGFTGPVDFVWTGPNGFSDSGRILNANTVYTTTVSDLTLNSAGTYSLVITTDEGCVSAPANIAITVNQGPNAGLQNNTPGTICGGSTASLSASPVGAGITYEWFLNGVSQGTTNDPTFAASSSGNYTVVAFQNGCPGNPSAAVAVNINPAGPNAAISSNMSGDVCSGEVVNFSVSPTGPGINYEWFRDGESIGTTGDGAFTLGEVTSADSGTYSVVASENGCPGQSSALITINVIETSQVASTITIDNPILCEGQDFQIDASPALEGAFYTWFLNGAPFASGFEPFIIVTGVTIANTGDYSVQISEQGCTSVESGSVAVTVFPTVTASLSTSASSVCNGESVTLTAAASAEGVTFNWFLDGVLFTSTTNPSLQVNMAGTYTVTTVQDICEGPPSNPVVIDVMNSPAAASISAVNTSLCPGEAVDITATDLGPDVTYNWFIDGNLVSTFTGNPSYVASGGPTMAGTYTVTPSIGPCEGASSNAITISIGEDVGTPVIAVDRNSICPGEAIMLSVSGIAGTPNFEWFRDGVSIGATSDPFFPTSGPGSYTVAVTEAQCGGGTSEPIVVTEMTPPDTGAIVAEDDSPCSDSNLNLTTTDLGEGITYSWFVDGQLLTTTTIPALSTPAVAGSYTLVPSAGGCVGATSNAIAVTVIDATTAIPTITADNSNLCPGEGIVLTANGINGPATYEWFLDGVSVQMTDEPILTLENPGAGNYTVVATGGDCGGGMSEAFAVTVIPVPDESAIIMEIPQIACGEMTTTLEGNVPMFGTGTWSSSDPDVVFSDINSAITTVTGITANNTVTWSLSDECGEYASDALMIDVEVGMATAAADNFTVPFNTALEGGNIIVNDLAEGDTELSIITQPSNGTASIVNGALQYVPNNGFSGTDVVEYQVCSNLCPVQVCDQAFANIVVEEAPFCVIPSIIPDVITPNNDGLNDAFNVPCADSRPLGLKIFNRWGDEVFETEAYNNNWAGTHDGEPLPPGPYYYILTDGDEEKRSGCIAITR